MWYRPTLCPGIQNLTLSTAAFPLGLRMHRRGPFLVGTNPVTDVFQTIALPPSPPLLVFSNLKAQGKLAYTFHQGIKVLYCGLIEHSGFVYFEVECCYLAYPDLEFSI